MDATDHTILPESEGGIGFPRYIRDGKKQIYLSYATPTSIKYKQLRGLAPNLNRLMAEEPRKVVSNRHYSSSRKSLPVWQTT